MSIIYSFASASNGTAGRWCQVPREGRENDSGIYEPGSSNPRLLALRHQSTVPVEALYATLVNRIEALRHTGVDHDTIIICR